jgi:F0F1-type ATP synthase membrane subunit b/b'
MLFITLFVVLIVIFGGAVLVLRHVLKAHVGMATTQFDSLAQESAARLAESKKRMEEAEAHYHATMTKAKADSEKMKQDLIAEGIKAKQEALDQARKQSEEIMDRAQSAAELIREELDKRVSEEAQQKALELIKKIMVGKIAEETHAHWIKELIQNGLDDLNRLHIPGQVEEIELHSAFPVTTAQKNALSEQLSKKLGKTLRFKEKVDPELILGIRFSIGGILVDGTLLHYFKERLEHGTSATSR